MIYPVSENSPSAGDSDLHNVYSLFRLLPAREIRCFCNVVISDAVCQFVRVGRCVPRNNNRLLVICIM